MEPNELQHLYTIQEGLEKHFSPVFVDSWNDDETIVFKCGIDCGLYKPTIWLSFPFYTESVLTSNPYDVVNAIWEYIVEYM